MSDNLDHFNDLPKRHKNHVTEQKAMTAFQNRITESGCFILQRADCNDYGTDCEIEVIDQGSATNIRIHVQLKGTESTLNADDSFSIDVSRSNFNYLLMQPHSFYASYHIPTMKLRMCLAETVLRQYEHMGKDWSHQQSITVKFKEDLTIDRLARLARVAKSSAILARNHRVEHVGASSDEVADLLRQTAPVINVPDDPNLASELLKTLYDQGHDEIIRSAFDNFEAVIGKYDEAMMFAYMSEINICMSHPRKSYKRIENSIIFFMKQLDVGRVEPACIYYTVGNAFSALGNEEEAKNNYEKALAQKGLVSMPLLVPQIHKNLGTSFERLGNEVKSIEHYTEALLLNPDLPEAHYALGRFYLKQGDWNKALSHLDLTIFTNRTKAAYVAAWRANALFNMGEGLSAFRDINSLLAQADYEPWIWNFFAQLVAKFGRLNIDDAKRSLKFWNLYVEKHPKSSDGYRELLLAKFYIRSKEQSNSLTYSEFRTEFYNDIEYILDKDEKAFLWDRLGHWAQDEEDWDEAERNFRNAYDLANGDYGYCLGTALNFLGRYQESLPILREQAERIQPDAMSWFQLGVAYENSGETDQAITAYNKAINLDPDYDLAMFNLGGVYWNQRDITEAFKIWGEAIVRFPNHELTDKLRHEIPALFSSPKD